jgi:hypothetical protein
MFLQVLPILLGIVKLVLVYSTSRLSRVSPVVETNMMVATWSRLNERNTYHKFRDMRRWRKQTPVCTCVSAVALSLWRTPPYPTTESCSSTPVRNLRNDTSAIKLTRWLGPPSFLVIDIAMGDSGTRRSIVSQLSSAFPGVYTNDNIAFVGTHQHSGVGGYLEQLLPQITSLGYVKQTADAIINGTVLAVKRAHASLAPGKLSLGNTTILNANINRSPTAYLANPAAERALYQFDQDKDMTVLRFDDSNGNARGLLSFFAVHGTSLYEVWRAIGVLSQFLILTCMR